MSKLRSYGRIRCGESAWDSNCILGEWNKEEYRSNPERHGGFPRAPAFLLTIIEQLNFTPFYFHSVLVVVERGGRECGNRRDRKPVHRHTSSFLPRYEAHDHRERRRREARSPYLLLHSYNFCNCLNPTPFTVPILCKSHFHHQEVSPFPFIWIQDPLSPF